ncbi:MAG: four helix bundle protein [Verrucomicrobia bacterium]|nr:four helix bundle protein [Verrucomicrobiota bacterium]MCH8510563.1 four helix bundle protein [Kiritimatiellia bacterium]
MAGITRFEDFECWQLARKCQQVVYKLTRNPSFHDDKDLRWQLRKAAVSVTSNIAEGFERDSSKEFAQFLKVAKGSNGEVRSQLYVALDEAYITQDEFESTVNLLQETGGKIAGLRKYLLNHIKKSEVRP